METLIIPVFPLQIVVFEGEELRLHIFEPRYIKLINECIASESEFGIPVIMDNEIMNAGCSLMVQKVENKFPGGEMDIVCKATRRFDVMEFYPSKNPDSASSGLVSFLPFVDDEDKELNLRLTDLINELLLLNKLEMEPIRLADFHINKWLHKCGLGIKKEFEMAVLPSTFERQLYLLNHLKNIVHVQGELQLMKRMIQLNGHFKKLNQSF